MKVIIHAHNLEVMWKGEERRERAGEGRGGDVEGRERR